MTIASSLRSTAVSDYRSIAEKIFCKALLEQIKQGQNQYIGEDLKLSDANRKVLDAQPQLDSGEKLKIDREIGKALLSYFVKVKAACDQQQWLDQQIQLLSQRDGLTEHTATALSQTIRLETYDSALFQAMQQEGNLLQVQQQLGWLQASLGLSSTDLPPAQQLRSEHKRVNYLRLWRRLHEQDWKAANQETYRVLLEAGKQEQRDSQVIDVERIPLLDLYTVDALWSEHSKGSSQHSYPTQAGRFGFSMQLAIWHSVAANPEAFGRQVGWRSINSWMSYDAIEFSLEAVPGHLPVFPHMGWWCWKGGMKALLERVAAAHNTVPKTLRPG